MKTIPLLLLFVLFYHTGLVAQNTSRVTVKAGNRIVDVLTTADILYYPQFIKGRVFFRDGTKSEAPLNYNRLVGEMQFIEPSGDTLALANPKTIRFIAVDKDTFYYDQGYLRLIGANNVAKLAHKQAWILGDQRRIGAYNTATPTTTGVSYDSYIELGGRYNLPVLQDVILKRVEQYYFGDKYNRFVLASKKNLLLLFSKDRQRIEAYLKENKVDFDNKDDLERVIQFLAQL